MGRETIIFELKKGDADSPHVSIQRSFHCLSLSLAPIPLCRLSLLSFDASYTYCSLRQGVLILVLSMHRNKSVPPPLVILTDLRRVACLFSFDAEKQTVRVEPITELEELQKRISKALSDGSSSDNAGGMH